LRKALDRGDQHEVCLVLIARPLLKLENSQPGDWLPGNGRYSLVEVALMQDIEVLGSAELNYFNIQYCLQLA